VAEAGVLLELRRFLVSRSRSRGAFTQLLLESQIDTKCDNFEELSMIIDDYRLLSLII
jgi:hypothetical protein